MRLFNLSCHGNMKTIAGPAGANANAFLSRTLPSLSNIQAISLLSRGDCLIVSKSKTGEISNRFLFDQ